MSRSSWRDVVVDVFTVSVMLAAVALHFWSMRDSAPWMVAIVAGRWPLSQAAKVMLQRGRTGRSEPPPPPPGGGSVTPPGPNSLPAPATTISQSDGNSDQASLPTSLVVLVLVLFAHALGLKDHLPRS